MFSGRCDGALLRFAIQEFVVYFDLSLRFGVREVCKG